MLLASRVLLFAPEMLSLSTSPSLARSSNEGWKGVSERTSRRRRLRLDRPQSGKYAEKRGKQRKSWQASKANALSLMR